MQAPALMPHTTIESAIDELAAEFELFTDWEDRYTHIIDRAAVRVKSGWLRNDGRTLRIASTSAAIPTRTLCVG
jgi:hypothetical protein